MLTVEIIPIYKGNRFGEIAHHASSASGSVQPVVDTENKFLLKIIHYYTGDFPCK